MTLESYLATAKAESPFKIEVRFVAGLTETQKAAFKTAADRWTKVIVGDLPAVQADIFLTYINEMNLVVRFANVA